MKVTSLIALILVIVGAINWFLIGLFGFDLVGFVTGGAGSMLSRVIYAIVGLAGLWTIFYLIMYNPLRRTH
ncbi:MAG: DUF378 domain-containing protein [Clostridia bacterium]|jgi:uncharacterized membrane protein YuzA (DUF378 family)|nr:DUF378 domain-containing protein [Clostridia bacterium]MBQ1942916.1 DUF378 domain-containing protein [Clostridia bacterium]MBQ5802076.1 DUF378 domain-containing protein [Clostridia bacterium]